MRPNLPVGDHTAEEMAELLNFKSKKAFYKKMRELGWLIIDKNGVRFGNHNLPKPEIIKAGLAYPVTCSYGIGENKERTREYRIPAFTQKGLNVLKKVILEGEAPPELKPKPKAPEPEKIPEPQKSSDPQKAKEERERAIESLRQMGIYH